MALPSGLNLKIELLFDYKSDTPKIRITDETDYAAEGRVAANIRGLIKLVNSEGVIAYQGTTFDAPDLDLSVSNVVIITPSNCGCSGKIQWCDTFTLTYSIQDVSNGNEFEKNFVKYLCFTPFDAKLAWNLDCYTATLSSSDCSSYKQGGITPTVNDYAHKLESLNDSPLDFSKLKTEFNFDCGKAVVPSVVNCERLGNNTNYLSSTNPFVIQTSSFQAINQPAYAEAGDFKFEYTTTKTVTIAITKNGTVIDTRVVGVGSGSYTIATTAGFDTITVTVATDGGTFSILIHPPCSLVKSELDGDAYSKCCNTLTLSYPELYSGLHSHSLSSDLVYELGDNWFIIYSVNYCEQFEVECNTDLCKIVCALYDKFKTYKNLLCQNSIKAAPLRAKLQWAYSLLALHDKLLKCGYEKKASDVIQGILDDLGISKSDCGCGCSGDNCDPQKILPILNKDAYVPPQITILEGSGIDIRLDNQTDPNINAYIISSEVSDFDEFEYLSFPFTDNTKELPMAFAAPFTSQVQVHAIDANFVSGLSYAVNQGAFINVTLPLASPIVIASSAHVDWKVTTVTGGRGSMVLKYKIV